MVLSLSGLKDRDGVVLEDATVTLVSLKDAAGTDVAGLTYPLALSHVADGLYEVSIPNTISVVARGVYKAKIKAVHDGRTATWTETAIAKEREA